MSATGRITVPAASVIPQGVGAPPPPGLDPKKGKLMCIKVKLLDDKTAVFHLGHKAIGNALFDEVCRHLNLLESDYFGLEFLDISGNRCWLDKEKSILRQITTARSDARFYFVVKFYPPNPADLEEEYTRYLFALQVRRDLVDGQLVVNENTAALMAAYMLQSECGDYYAEDYPDHSYLSGARFIPNQSAEFLKQVLENYKKLVGMDPTDSELQLLEVARRVEFYGIKFHPARDIEGTVVSLSVIHLGVKVYHQLTCANTFSWAKIRKLSFKRKKFLIKLHPESYAYYKDTIEFIFETRNECKMFWKKCIEHHTFFRCAQTPVPYCKSSQSKLFPRGSSFRYSGRTQQQLLDYIREHHRRREPFTRPVLSAQSRSSTIDHSSLPRSGHYPSSGRNGTTVHGHSSLPRTGEVVAPSGARLTRVRTFDDGGGVGDYPAATGASSANNVSSFGFTRAVSSSTQQGSGTTVNQSQNSYVLEESTVVVQTNGHSLSITDHQVEATVNGNADAEVVAELQSTLVISDCDRSPVLEEPPLPPPPPCYLRTSTMSPPPPPPKPKFFNASLSSVLSPQPSTEQDQSLAMSDAFGSLEKSSGKHSSPMPQCYEIAKELLMTERTFSNDLNILYPDWFSIANTFLSDNADLSSVVSSLQNAIEIIFHQQQSFLAELEQRFNSWNDLSSTITKIMQDQQSTCKIGDILLRLVHNTQQAYESYVRTLANYLSPIFVDFYRNNRQFCEACQFFESNERCYLPLFKLLLKPMQRVFFRHSSLNALVAKYKSEPDHNADLSECQVALEKLTSLMQSVESVVDAIEDTAKFIEVERDFGGVPANELLTTPHKPLLRQGLLNAQTNNGWSPVLVLLFDDLLLYAVKSKKTASALPGTDSLFRVCGTLILHGITIEDGCRSGQISGQGLADAASMPMIDDEMTNCFTLTSSEELVFLANNASEKRDWIEDISQAVISAAENVDKYRLCLPTVKSTIDAASQPAEQRGCSSLHVCWHRAKSVSRLQSRLSSRLQLSGYLQRKFRSTTGWQTLFVVLCDFRLFFYKVHSDDLPLANLPLLGYELGDTPDAESNIRKRFVFKLSHKASSHRTHFYYFRADSEYSFHRWIESLKSSCIFNDEF